MPIDDYMYFVKVCPQHSLLIAHTEARNHKSENAICKYYMDVL